MVNLNTDEMKAAADEHERCGIVRNPLVVVASGEKKSARA